MGLAARYKTEGSHHGPFLKAFHFRSFATGSGVLSLVRRRVSADMNNAPLAPHTAKMFEGSFWYWLFKSLEAGWAPCYFL